MNELEKKVTFPEKEVLLDSKTCGFATEVDGSCGSGNFTTELIDLPAIEARIAGHMQGIAFNLLQVGRCLVIAKEANLVPHGKWEEWVRFHTGMSERRAQRLMQAVSIAPEGSRIAELPVSKIMALLPLPEDQREDVAAAALQENLTVKQLQEKVDRMTSDYNDGMTRMRGQLQKQLKANDRLIEDKAALERQNRNLERQLAEKASMEESSPAGISPEAQAMIDDLKDQLKAAEDYAEEQAALRQELEQGQLDGALTGADPEEVFTFGADDLTVYTATFLGRCGILAHMGPELSRMDNKSRNLIRQQIDYVDAWVKNAYAALDAHIIVEG